MELYIDKMPKVIWNTNTIATNTMKEANLDKPH